MCFNAKKCKHPQYIQETSKNLVILSTRSGSIVSSGLLPIPRRNPVTSAGMNIGYINDISAKATRTLNFVRKSCMVFCSAADNGKLDRFLNRCKKNYRCQQLNQDISSELFNLADQALFSSLQKNSHHVLHRLLPAKSTQPLSSPSQFFPYSKTIQLR